MYLESIEYRLFSVKISTNKKMNMYNPISTSSFSIDLPYSIDPGILLHMVLLLVDLYSGFKVR